MIQRLVLLGLGLLIVGRADAQVDRRLRVRIDPIALLARLRGGGQAHARGRGERGQPVQFVHRSCPSGESPPS